MPLAVPHQQKQQEQQRDGRSVPPVVPQEQKPPALPQEQKPPVLPQEQKPPALSQKDEDEVAIIIMLKFSYNSYACHR